MKNNISFGLYYKDQRLGTLLLKNNVTSFYYENNFLDLNLNTIPNFPLLKGYQHKSVYSFLINRVSSSKIKEIKSFYDLIIIGKKVAHSPIVIKEDL